MNCWTCRKIRICGSMRFKA